MTVEIIIPDDYQDAVRTLDCFTKLAGHEVVVFRDTVKSVDALAERFKDAEALVLIRERKCITYEVYLGAAFDQIVAFAAGKPIHVLS